MIIIDQNCYQPMRQARIEQGLTQRQLGEKSGIYGYRGKVMSMKNLSGSTYLRQIDQAVQAIKQNSGRELEYMTMAMKMHDERWLGRAEGENKKLLDDLRALMENLGLSADKAMDALNVPAEDRGKYRELLTEQ